MARFWATMTPVSSPLYHRSTFFPAVWVDCLKETGLIAVLTTTIIHSSSPSLSSSSPLSGARACLIHTHLFAQEFLSVQALNRCFGLSLCRHLYKAKSSGLTSILVLDHSCRGYFAEGFKELPDRFVCCVIRYISYVNIHHHAPQPGLICPLFVRGLFDFTTKKPAKKLIRVLAGISYKPKRLCATCLLNKIIC